jgi:hypothetical protein
MARVASGALHYRSFSLRSRAVAFIVAAGLALALQGNAFVSQVGWGLQYLSGVVLAIMMTFAGVLLFGNLGVIALWRGLDLFHAEPKGWLARQWWNLIKPGGRWREAITLLNRNLSHIEGTALWVLAILAWSPDIRWQAIAVTGVLVVGEPLFDLFGRALLERYPACLDPDRVPPAGSANGTFFEEEIHWARRPAIHAATVVGVIWVFNLAPKQASVALPLLIALGGSALIRFGFWLWDFKHGIKDEARRKRRYRNARAHLSRFARFDTPVLATGPLFLAFIYGVASSAETSAANGSAWSETPVACLADPGLAPDDVDISVTVLSDAHLHNLGGERFAGQLGVAKALVRFAHHPVESDLLTPATLPHLAAMEEEMGRAKAGWVFLGDLADLGCESEVQRALAGLDAFGKDRALGVAMGNRDGRFGGGVWWSPHSDEACLNPLDKGKASDLVLGGFSEGVAAAGGTIERVHARTGWMRGFPQKGDAVVGVSPLGSTKHQGKLRLVVGVFLDTAEDIDLDFGLTGDQGALSKAQIRAADRQLAASDEDGDALLIFFTHHPVADLSGEARGRLGAWIAELEADGPRVLGVVSGHARRAQKHEGTCIGGRSLDNLIVGSTADAPQEMARLEVGPDRYGIATLSVRTIPSVNREDMTCASSPAPSWEDCQRRVGELSLHTECRALLERDGSGGAAECQALEADVPILSQLANLKESPSATQLRTAEAIRAKHLFDCLCRDGQCSPSDGADYLDPSVSDALLSEVREHSAEARTELACLAWAAGSLADHAEAGMEMADALRCAFDDHSAQPARIMLTKLEERACF